jgi:hypothetical protein
MKRSKLYKWWFYFCADCFSGNAETKPLLCVFMRNLSKELTKNAETNPKK